MLKIGEPNERKKRGNVILVVCVVLVVLLALYTLSGIGENPTYAYPDSTQTIFSAIGYPGQVSDSTSLSAYPVQNQPGKIEPIIEISIPASTPVPVVGVENFPTFEHGHRHFERPARPIMPIATPMTGNGESVQSTTILATNLTEQVYLPIVVSPPYRSVKVFAVAYINEVIDPQVLELLHSQLVNDLTTGSKWHGYTNTSAASAFVYFTHPDGIVKLYESPPYLPSGLFDYDAVYQRFDLCGKIQNGEVDEVWIWGNETGNAAEFVVNGPSWNAIPNGYSVPNCGQTVATFNFRFDLQVNYALHSYNHRVEDALLRFSVSGNSTCDFITETGPPPSRRGDVSPISSPDCTGPLYQSDQFGFTARPMTTNNFVSVCGDVHYPPNIFPPWITTNEYIYWDTTTVSSRCQDWQWDNNVNPTTFTCSVWGCNEEGYLIWWMQNIPGIDNNNEDRNQNYQPIWWDHLWK